MPDVKKEVLLTIQPFDKKYKGNSQNVIEVVTFNEGAPQLIKQNYYKGSDGEWMPAKLKGFTLEDLKFLKSKEKRAELFSALNNQ